MYICNKIISYKLKKYILYIKIKQINNIYIYI